MGDRWAACVLAGALMVGCDGEDSAPEAETGAMVTEESGEPPSAEDACEGLPGACAGEGVCEAYACGGRAAIYNHFGCPRTTCDGNADCPDGEACFVVVYDTACASSSVECSEIDGACTCASTDDCAGVTRAHCLPTQFYPEDAYCDVAAWDCEGLPAWVEALELAEDSLRGSGRTELADGVGECLVAARGAVEAC
jgi:hypothetical protein